MPDTDHWRDITKLAWYFPKEMIESAPKGGGSYVSHGLVEQRFLAVLGYTPDTELVEVVRGLVLAEQGTGKSGDSARKQYGKPELPNAVVGVVLKMTCVIDGEVRSATEAGDCGDPHNWPHDGARLKDAMSDAYKRCAMRLGVGLHLWIKQPQKRYTVHQVLASTDDMANAIDATGREAEVPETEPMDPELLPGESPQADDSEATEPSQVPEPPEPPQGEPERSEVDWGEVVRYAAKVTQADALRLAHACADEHDPPLDRPTSLRRIPAALDEPLFAAITALSAERIA